MNDQEDLQKSITKGARLVGAVIGCVFAGIGLTLLGFLWSQPFGGFHSPPLFFRIFGSLIAIPFAFIGGFTAFKAITVSAERHLPSKRSEMRPSQSYACPHCNAPIGDESDVSPSGDVKCTYCKSWFNIHHD